MTGVQPDLFRSHSGTESPIGVAVKTLVAVDLPNAGSNQHELNGVAQLREILGTETITGAPVRWYVLTDEDSDPIITDSQYTWYDARANIEGRTEWRLYYYDPSGLESASEGDRVFIVSLQHGSQPGLLAYVAPPESSWSRQLCWLFGIDEGGEQRWTVRDANALAERAGQIASTDLLEFLELDRGTAQTELSDLELVRRRFGSKFPSTREFSAFARDVSEVGVDRSPDEVLLQWIDREEKLFRALEERIVSEKLDDGFSDVDEFISFSLSVQNRRKSRMGYALENHLRAIFDAADTRYSHNPVTEQQSRPDFLFPGITEYRDPDFPADGLYMLAAKSTCKDRWRQVLTEAARIHTKHLCTLEPGISENQTDEMQAESVRLVVPRPVHESYRECQRDWLLDLESFLELVA